MNKILLIIQREYLVRVRKKSFLIMSLVGPVLLGLLMIVPIWLATMDTEKKTIEVLDESGLFADKFVSDNERDYLLISGPLAQAKQRFLASDHDGLLYIPKMDIDNPAGVSLFAPNNPSLDTQNELQKLLATQIEQQKMARSGIDQKTIDNLKTKVSIKTVNLSLAGEKRSNSALSTGIGFFLAFLIYIFIFLYGVQIMRGVIEEKTNRIVEVIISSVKPFQLMMGKIVGIALVGLTQLALWITLSFLITTFVSSRYQLDRFKDQNMEQTMSTMKSAADVKQAASIGELVSGIDAMNLSAILAAFVFYFLGGYLLYGALFGAIGAAVDNETDTQQFMLPITIPLILSFVVAQSIITKDPNGTLAFWMSMIPFTSPIVMMIRMPFGVPTGQLLMSMGLLILGFVFTTWLAGRIYRIGILMYGKKPSYRELSKWIFYRG